MMRSSLAIKKILFHELKIAIQHLKKEMMNSVTVLFDYVPFINVAFHRHRDSRPSQVVFNSPRSSSYRFMDTAHQLYQLRVTQTHSISSVFTSKHQSNRWQFTYNYECTLSFQLRQTL